MASHVLTNDRLLDAPDIVARLSEFAVRVGDRHGEDTPDLTGGSVEAAIDEPGKLVDLEAAVGL